MPSDQLIQRITDPNAGYRCVAELERRDRQRWLKNMLRPSRITLNKRRTAPIRTS